MQIFVGGIFLREGRDNIHLILKGVCFQIKKCRFHTFLAPDKLIYSFPGLTGGNMCEGEIPGGFGRPPQSSPAALRGLKCHRNKEPWL